MNTDFNSNDDSTDETLFLCLFCLLLFYWFLFHLNTQMKKKMKNEILLYEMV